MLFGSVGYHLHPAGYVSIFFNLYRANLNSRNRFGGTGTMEAVCHRRWDEGDQEVWECRSIATDSRPGISSIRWVAVGSALRPIFDCFSCGNLATACFISKLSQGILELIFWFFYWVALNTNNEHYCSVLHRPRSGNWYSTILFIPGSTWLAA